MARIVPDDDFFVFLTSLVYKKILAKESVLPKSSPQATRLCGEPYNNLQQPSQNQGSLTVY
jgi:hypothetical protein